MEVIVWGSLTFPWFNDCACAMNKVVFSMRLCSSMAWLHSYFWHFHISQGSSHCLRHFTFSKALITPPKAVLGLFVGTWTSPMHFTWNILELCPSCQCISWCVIIFKATLHLQHTWQQFAIHCMTWKGYWMMFHSPEILGVMWVCLGLNILKSKWTAIRITYIIFWCHLVG